MLLLQKMGAEIQSLVGEKGKNVFEVDCVAATLMCAAKQSN